MYTTGHRSNPDLLNLSPGVLFLVSMLFCPFYTAPHSPHPPVPMSKDEVIYCLGWNKDIFSSFCSGTITSDLWFGLKIDLLGLIPHCANIHIGIVTCKWTLVVVLFFVCLLLFSNREAHKPPPFIFSLPACGPHPHSLQGQPYLSTPFPAKRHWHSKQTPVSKQDFGHLFCPSLENAIKPAWQLCQHEGQRGLHGKKLCKIHSSKGCVKNIPTKKGFSSKWNIVASASFSFPYFASVMDLC